MEWKKKKRPSWHYGSYVFMMYLAVSSPESQLEVLISLKQKRLWAPCPVTESPPSMSLTSTLVQFASENKINAQTKTVEEQHDTPRILASRSYRISHIEINRHSQLSPPKSPPLARYRVCALQVWSVCTAHKALSTSQAGGSRVSRLCDLCPWASDQKCVLLT